MSALLGRLPSEVGYQPTLQSEMGELQERITTTSRGSVTLIQVVFIPADDLTDPAVVATFAHLDATTVLSREQVSRGLPGDRSLASRSSLLTPEGVGNQHYAVAMRVRELLARYEELQDVIAILGMEELSEDDRTAVHRARRLQRFLTQPLTVAEAFTGTAGAHVPLSETLRGFQEIVDGLHDGVPEQAFYMAGTIDDVVRRGHALA